PPRAGQLRRPLARGGRAPHRLELRGPRLRDAPGIRHDRPGDRARGRLPEHPGDRAAGSAGLALPARRLRRRPQRLDRCVPSGGPRRDLERAAARGAADVLLRAVPWGLNALLCTTGLVTATAWLVRRHRVPVSSDAPWLAAAALLIASNFVARASVTLQAFDTIGLVIVLAVGFLSIQGIGLRGRQAWHYLRAGFDAALSAWIGVFPLVGRDVTWSELPRGGRLTCCCAPCRGGSMRSSAPRGSLRRRRGWCVATACRSAPTPPGSRR